MMQRRRPKLPNQQWSPWYRNGSGGVVLDFSDDCASKDGSIMTVQNHRTIKEMMNGVSNVNIYNALTNFGVGDVLQ
jgi:hypothetical protein